jgi:NAD(P)-dependent dehydrogenase (short-subunit alcohol dehydrogenase family)
MHRDPAEQAGQVRAGLPGSGHTVVRANLADAGAVRQMAGQAAADLGGLDVGYVETEMAAADLNSPRGREIRAQSPFNRVAQPAGIAAAVIYLAFDQGEWASGAILDLNGASCLRS